MSYVITSWDLVFLMFSMVFAGFVIATMTFGFWFMWMKVKLMSKYYMLPEDDGEE